MSESRSANEFDNFDFSGFVDIINKDKNYHIKKIKKFYIPPVPSLAQFVLDNEYKWAETSTKNDDFNITITRGVNESRPFDGFAKLFTIIKPVPENSTKKDSSKRFNNIKRILLSISKGSTPNATKHSDASVESLYPKESASFAEEWTDAKCRQDTIQGSREKSIQSLVNVTEMDETIIENTTLFQQTTCTASMSILRSNQNLEKSHQQTANLTRTNSRKLKRIQATQSIEEIDEHEKLNAAPSAAGSLISIDSQNQYDDSENITDDSDKTIFNPADSMVADNHLEIQLTNTHTFIRRLSKILESSIDWDDSKSLTMRSVSSPDYSTPVWHDELVDTFEDYMHFQQQIKRIARKISQFESQSDVHNIKLAELKTFSKDLQEFKPQMFVGEEAFDVQALQGLDKLLEDIEIITYLVQNYESIFSEPLTENTPHFQKIVKLLENALQKDI